MLSTTAKSASTTLLHSPFETLSSPSLPLPLASVSLAAPTVASYRSLLDGVLWCWPCVWVDGKLGEVGKPRVGESDESGAGMTWGGDLGLSRCRSVADSGVVVLAVVVVVVVVKSREKLEVERRNATTAQMLLEACCGARITRSDRRAF